MNVQGDIDIFQNTKIIEVHTEYYVYEKINDFESSINMTMYELKIEKPNVSNHFWITNN